MCVGRRCLISVVWATRGELYLAALKGFRLMLLLLGRSVPLSFVHRVTSCCQLSPLTPVLLRSAQIKLRAIIHSTVRAAGQNTATMPERRPFVRLPTDVYPVNYGLCLKPDLIDFTFEGKLEAMVEVCCTRASG